MKHIIKSKEPQSLKEYRSTPKASFDGCHRADIRTQLLLEQKYICAYCMRRISDEWDVILNKPKMEIEHYLPQFMYNGKNGYPDFTLDYKNMLGVCNGNAGKPHHLLHCDKSKDLKHDASQYPLRINPQLQECETLLRFHINGEVHSPDPKVEYELNNVFNLNEENLVNGRREVIDSLYGHLKGKKNLVKEIRKLIRIWESESNNKYMEYCQVALYHLNKLLIQEEYKKD